MELRMPYVNRVSLSGRLTRDGELKYLPSGVALFKFNIAVTKKRKDKPDKVVFINCTAWDKSAEYLNTQIAKGDPVLVEGELCESSWDDKQTGAKRTVHEIDHCRVECLGWKEKANQPYQSAPPPRPIEEPEAEDSIPF